MIPKVGEISPLINFSTVVFPELERILEKMNGILTDQEMADMNYKVDVEHRTEREVAVEFLKKKGLLNPQLSYGK